jgi:hypothetical protein
VETSLHQQLKYLYASDDSNTEVRFAGFRIDAIAEDGELIEIQHASLGALRDKTRKLLPARSKHRLRIVKPIVRRKRVTTIGAKDGEVLRSRMSPKTGDWLDLFNDLVHFVTVFPRKGLTLEVVLIDAEEFRTDRIPKRRRGKNYQSLDIQLLEVGDRIVFGSVADLMQRLPMQHLASPFDTAQLAVALGRPRWLAQKVAYCLREIGGISPAGKKGNSQLYSLTKKRRSTPKSAA